MSSTTRSAEFHPLQYLNGLAAAFVGKHGGQLYEMSRVKGRDIGLDGTVGVEWGWQVFWGVCVLG